MSNSPAHIFLWTYHARNFSLLDGSVDVSKSPYAKTVPRYLEIRERLVEILGVDQFIWCCTNSDKWEITSNTTGVEWHLQIPKSEILVVIDSFVWNRLLGISNVLPPRSLMAQWRREASARFPQDGLRQRQYEEEMEHKYWAMKPAKGDWWGELFLDPSLLDDERATPLIRYPVRPEWVMGTRSMKDIYEERNRRILTYRNRGTCHTRVK